VRLRTCNALLCVAVQRRALRDPPRGTVADLTELVSGGRAAMPLARIGYRTPAVRVGDGRTCKAAIIVGALTPKQAGVVGCPRPT
jgi:hypothetical protein